MRKSTESALKAQTCIEGIDRWTCKMDEYSGHHPATSDHIDITLNTVKDKVGEQVEKSIGLLRPFLNLITFGLIDKHVY